MLNLTKGGTLNLTKEGVSNNACVFGLGWQGKGGRSMDLDSYIAVLDANDKVLDFIYFGNKSCNGIKHNGDDVVGGGSSKAKVPNETIKINLSSLDSRASKLIAGLFIYSGGNDLSNVDFAFTNLVDQTGKEIVNYDIREDFKGCKGLEVAAVEKLNGEWIFKALGDGNTLSYSAVKEKYSPGRQMGVTTVSVGSGSGGGFFRRLFSTD